MVFVLSILIPHLSFRYLGKAVFRDCGISGVSSFIFLFMFLSFVYVFNKTQFVLNLSTLSADSVDGHLRKARKHFYHENIYNFDPLKPHFYTVRLAFTGVYIIYLISV